MRSSYRKSVTGELACCVPLAGVTDGSHEDSSVVVIGNIQVMRTNADASTIQNRIYKFIILHRSKSIRRNGLHIQYMMCII